MTPHAPSTRNPRRASLMLALATVLALLLAPTAQASDYEMRFCAPLNAWPAADRERGGYDVEIALLLADELGADASFEWIRFDEVGVRDSLHSGLCDLMVGMGEGVAGTLSSVAYLRTPYVFVTREERDLTIASLDDPILQDLIIGTYQFGTPTIALQNREMDNRVEFAADVTDEGVDTHTPIIEAVLDGTVDVGIVYGPEAGIRIVEGAPLRIEQVRPEIDFGEAIIQLSRIWTIGTRPHDEALRDRLNAALARRWDDVQAILASYGVPTLDLPRPVEAAPIPDDVLRVGIVYPARTPAQIPGFEVGEASRLGTLLAENRLARSDDLSDAVRVYLASAPSTASALRGAAGMIHGDGIDVVIGGFGANVALGLADLAAEESVVFLNAVSEDARLRTPQCFPTTVHVVPDVDAYVRAMVASGLGHDPAPTSWYAVVEAPYAEADGIERLASAVSEAGGTLVGSAVVDTGQFLYLDAVADVEATGAEAVMLIMNEEQQELFMSQARSLAGSVAVTGLPTLRSQSRAFLQRFLQVSDELTATPRVAVWDPALENDVNDRFSTRTAEALGGAGWTTYAAFLMAFDAAEQGAGREAEGLIDFWVASAGLDVGKETSARVQPGTLQLTSTLYLVEPVPGAPWGRTPSEKAATARVAGVVPAELAWPAGSAAPGSAGDACPTP